MVFQYRVLYFIFTLDAILELLSSFIQTYSSGQDYHGCILQVFLSVMKCYLECMPFSCRHLLLLGSFKPVKEITINPQGPHMPK